MGVDPQTTVGSTFGIPSNVVGLRLCRAKGDVLRMCQNVTFTRGAIGVDIVLRRAQLAGNVGPIGETGDWWADLTLDNDGTWMETIALSAEAWRSLKNHLMRCKYVRS